MPLIPRPSVVFPRLKLDQEELPAALVDHHPDAGDAVAHMRATGVRIPSAAERCHRWCPRYSNSSRRTAGTHRSSTSTCRTPETPAIMDAVEQGLGLPAGMVDPSRHSRAEVDNCSSMSVFDVLRRHHESPPDDCPLGMTVAFGPGFTAEATLDHCVAAPVQRSTQAEAGHAVPVVAA